MTQAKEHRASIGFITSLFAGIFIMVNALALFTLAEFIESLGGLLPIFIEGLFSTLAAIGVILAVLVIIGAILIYMPGREILGAILVLIGSVLSLGIGGGFIIGLVLGVIGGCLGLVKK